MKPTIFPLTTAVFLAVAAPLALAADFSIDWFTVDGGGGTSAGGVYSLSGTIGQPDAGMMSGGPFTLVGGFWGGVSAIQTPGAPKLKVVRDTLLDEVTISWPLPATDFVLEQTPDLNTIPDSWLVVPVSTYQTNATDIFIKIQPPLGAKYFRLHNTK